MLALKEKVDCFNGKYKGVIGAETPPPRSSPPGTAPPSSNPVRTLSQPQYSDGDRPLNVMATLLPASILDVSEFEASKEFLG